MIENGVSLEDLGERKFGHKIHIWDIRHRKNIQTLDLGDDYQMILELRPAHDPTKAYGFVNAVLNMNDLSSSIWTWYKDGGTVGASKRLLIFRHRHQKIRTTYLPL